MRADKRNARRQGICWDGLIVDLAGSIVGYCRMMDVSAAGAKLTVETPTDAPDNFVLLLSKNGEVRRQCTIAWRSKESVWVRFVGSRSSAHVVISHLSDALARIAPKALGGG